MISCILAIIISISIHELIHYIVANKFKRNPSLRFSLYTMPYILYDDSEHDFQNCIISISPIVFHILALLYFSEAFKFINFFFCFMILPISDDGLVFWESVCKIIKKAKCSYVKKMNKKNLL